MTTLQAAFKTKLSGDATLAALATGGIHDADSLGRQGLELADVCAGTPIVQPALYIRWSTDNPYSLWGSSEIYVELYFYQDGGYATTRQMRRRAYELLHRAHVAFTEPVGDYLMDFWWAGDVLEQVDDSLAGASMERSRYVGYLTKG